jgi:hypothetical protein
MYSLSLTRSKSSQSTNRRCSFMSLDREVGFENVGERNDADGGGVWAR